LLNDRAGAFKHANSLEELQQMARLVGLEAELIPTGSAQELRETVRKLVAEGAPRLAVAGGDGTVSLAVQELAHGDTVLGILPLGTANNFAAALHIPQDLPSALRVLKEGVVLEVDLGEAGGHYFSEAAGTGLFADALALYGQGTNKNFFRGLYALLRVVLSLRAHGLRLIIDGEPHVERAVMCTVANSYRTAQAVPIAPGAKLTDGKLDVVVIGNLKLRELLPYYRAVRAQLHASLPKVSRFQAKELRLESRRPMNVHCDDQVVGTTPVTLTVHAGALKVLVERL
jgi:YegS/Rv2252/BmrU family lipid kinase